MEGDYFTAELLLIAPRYRVYQISWAIKLLKPRWVNCRFSRARVAEGRLIYISAAL